MAALDQLMPVFRHRERHSRTIDAAPDAVWDAMLAVTASEVPLSRLLMGIRSLPPRVAGRRDSFNTAAARPVIQTFLTTGFRTLAEERPRLLIIGAAMQPWRLVGGQVADVVDAAGFRAFDRPGFVLAALSLELEPIAARTRLSTETRVRPTDRQAARAFLPYWLAIRLGSGLIRRDLLRAVAARAERVRVAER